MEIEDGTHESNRSRNEVLKKMFREVRHRLEKANNLDDVRYNFRRRQKDSYTNQLVWRRNYVLSDASKYISAKLAPRFVYP